MEKLVYLLHQSDDVPGEDLRVALVDLTAPAIREAGGSGLCVSIEDDAVRPGQGVRIRRADPPLRAMVSFWLDNADDRDPCEMALRDQAAVLDGYLVAESVPLRFDGPKGKRAPGFSLVTCIRRKPDISEDDFFERWTVEHKAVAFETQSTFAYTRNAVVRALTPRAHTWDGVVEESFPLEALSDPKAWYDTDSDEVYRERLQRMIASVSAFLDLADMESIPMSVYALD